MADGYSLAGSVTANFHSIHVDAIDFDKNIFNSTKFSIFKTSTTTRLMCDDR